jgi:hypothetical protein
MHFDVFDRCLEIDDLTNVTVSLGYSPLTPPPNNPHSSCGPHGPFVPVPELPGNVSIISGKWYQVAPRLREITPLNAGYYILAVQAFVDVAVNYHVAVPQVLKAITYVSPVVCVEAH